MAMMASIVQYARVGPGPGKMPCRPVPARASACWVPSVARCALWVLGERPGPKISRPTLPLLLGLRQAFIGSSVCHPRRPVRPGGIRLSVLCFLIFFFQQKKCFYMIDTNIPGISSRKSADPKGGFLDEMVRPGL